MRLRLGGFYRYLNIFGEAVIVSAEASLWLLL